LEKNFIAIIGIDYDPASRPKTSYYGSIRRLIKEDDVIALL
jgi:hypothetical protein